MQISKGELGATIGVCLLCGFLSGFAITLPYGRKEGYRNGQLDYQRGVIQYHITEDGKSYYELKELD